MKIHSLFLYLFFLSLVFFAPSGQGSSVKNIFSDETLGDDFVIESHELSGSWKGEEKWHETFCSESFYRYRADLKASLSTVDFELKANGSVDVYAGLYDLSGDFNGSYRGSPSLCEMVESNLWVGMDRAEVYTEMTFNGNGESLADMNLRVKATRLGTVRLGAYVPGWLEDFITDLSNHVLAKLWASWLGGWISDKVTEIIKGSIPHDDPSAFE